MMGLQTSDHPNRTSPGCMQLTEDVSKSAGVILINSEFSFLLPAVGFDSVGWDGTY